MTTYRWADAHTMIVRSDGAMFPPDDDNRDYADLLASGAEIAPFRRWRDVAEAKVVLTAEAESIARALRIAVAGTDDPTKLAIYREKYDVAKAAIAGDAAALGRLAPEATARGETAAELAALVGSLGEAWTTAGMQIDAAYQGHKAAINRIADLAGADAYDVNAGWPG